jgi:hypothetical protein
VANGSPDMTAVSRRFAFVQHVHNVHNYLSQSIATAGVKANLLLVVAFGVAAVLATNYHDNRDLFAKEAGKRYALTPAVLALTWAVMWLLAAAWRRLGQARRSHIYFEHLRQRETADDVYRELSSLDDDRLIRELTAHNFALAGITAQKFSATSLAVIGLAVGLGAALGVYFF